METTMLMYFWGKADDAIRDKKSPDRVVAEAKADLDAKRVVAVGALRGIDPKEIKL